MNQCNSINEKAGPFEDKTPDLQTSVKRSPEIGLVDIQGYPVKENTDYFLEIYGQPDDVLKFDVDKDYMPLYATYRLNKASNILVRYTLIDDIHYLTHKNRFLQLGENEGELDFKEEKPEKQNTLEFHITENGSIKITQLDKDIWLAFNKKSINFTEITFRTNDDGAVHHKAVELLLRRDVRESIDVLIPKGFDIGSIEKCMMDFDSNRILYTNEEAINSRLGSNFIVLHENYFVAYVGKNQVTCDYNCRNRIMKQLCPNKGDDYYAEWIANDCHLNKIDGIIHNTISPYYLFTNEYIRDDEITNNTIILDYTTNDPNEMADIIKAKSYNYNFFGFYFEGVCVFHITETNESFGLEAPWEVGVGNFVVDRLCHGFNGPSSQLNSDYTDYTKFVNKESDPLIRSPDFQLKDIEGHIVEENADYYLVLYDNDLDVLQLDETFCPQFNTISATSHDSHGDIVIVRCSIINGIYYLLCNNKYLQFANDDEQGYDIGLTGQLPSKKQRLQFQVTDNNTFKTVPWNQREYLKLDIITGSYSALSFFANSKPLELFLKRVCSQ